MNDYEQYWDTLLSMWDNAAIISYLQTSCSMYDNISYEYAQWVEDYR